MNTQTVFRINKGTSYEDITVNKEEIPVPAANEILVRVKAVSLNYRDIAISTGEYPVQVKPDVVPCSDASGEVVSFGHNVRGFEIGDKVVSIFNITNLYGPPQNLEGALGGTIDGVLREYVALPYEAVVKTPSHLKLSWEHLASLVCTGTTAWNALYGNNKLEPGQIVLLQGTGGVSMTGLLLAKAAGATTILTSSSDEKLEQIKAEYGVDYTVNYKRFPKWGEAVNQMIGNNRVDYIFENGGSGNIEQSVECIAYGGQIAIIGFLNVAKQAEMPDAVALALSKGCVMRGIPVGSKQLLGELMRLVSSKDIFVPVDSRFKFSKSGVIEAYKHVESGNHIGKVCVTLY